jgi:hypothetical protein
MFTQENKKITKVKMSRHLALKSTGKSSTNWQNPEIGKCLIFVVNTIIYR